jgi:UDP-GlcNAc3NAcA epimerase
MILLESSCEMIMTDSGGVQKEAFFFNKPVIVLRSETEWKEIIDEGCGIIADASETKIEEAYEHFKTMKGTLKFPSLFGDGQAARFICQTILANG